MILKYQQIAMNSLAGPATLWRSDTKPGVPTGHNFATLAGNQMSKPALPPTTLSPDIPLSYKYPFHSFPPVLPPFLYQADTESSELIYCELEGSQIAGFRIGGEDRLCVPQILHTLLRGIDVKLIDGACVQLFIHCSNCTVQQLLLMKQGDIIPGNRPSCGLMRLTDAERLCTLLLHSKATQITDPSCRKYPQINNTCVPVYHECFGEGHGFLYTELYTHALAKCISCADCEKLFTPDRFVTHTHFNQENMICHWGFNRRNWRCYLLLSDEEICDEDMQIMEGVFQQMLDKYKNSAKKRKVRQKF